MITCSDHLYSMRMPKWGWSHSFRVAFLNGVWFLLAVYFMIRVNGASVLCGCGLSTGTSPCTGRPLRVASAPPPEPLQGRVYGDLCLQNVRVGPLSKSRTHAINSKSYEVKFQRSYPGSIEQRTSARRAGANAKRFGMSNHCHRKKYM